MKKINQLFIIFIILFLFGDIFTTYVGMSVSKSAIAEKVKIPEKCICTYPPECDSSPVVNYIKGDIINFYNWILPIILKILMIIFIYLFIKKKDVLYYVLGVLDICLIAVVLGNLGVVFHPFRTLFTIIVGISILFFVNYYFKPRLAGEKNE